MNSIKTWWQSLSKLHKILFVLFLALLIGSRFYLLGQIPVGLHYDELMYLINAKATAFSGSDLTGNWHFWKLMPVTPLHSELTTLVFIPGFWLINNPLFAGRVIPALLGITFPFIFGLLAWNLWNNKQIAWATIIVAAFNPWIWQLSRMSFDPLPGMWLSFLFAMLITIKPARSWYRWLAFPILFFSFFQYQGYKIILPIWTIIWAYYGWRIKKSLTKQWTLALAIFIIGLFSLWYAVLLPLQGASERGNKTIFFDPDFKTEITGYVTTNRRLSLTSPFIEVANNKVQELGLYLAKKYISAFDPLTLFVSGEPNFSPFSVWTQGFFYLVDLPLLAIGLYQLAAHRRWRNTAIIWGVLFILMPLPRLITTVNDWMIFRSSMGYMLMILPIGIGLYYAMQARQTWFKWVVIGLYSLFILRFAYDYFYRYPIYSTNGLVFDQRVIASYIHRRETDTPVTMYTEFPEFSFFLYLYYNNLVNAQNLPIIRANLQQGRNELSNIRFTEECVASLDSEEGIIIAERSRKLCPPSGLSDQELAKLDLTIKPGEASSISSPLDSGEIFWIYQDTLCQNEQLTTFVNVDTLDQLQVEQLSDQQFCNLWIKDLNSLRDASSH